MDPRDIETQKVISQMLAEGGIGLDLPSKPKIPSQLGFNRGQLILHLMKPEEDRAFYGYIKPKISTDGIGIKDAGLVYKRTF